ncbi:uncharacterized protein LOC134528328 [Bacillus rossius redtenbacheri]|uniref:uncharacterized protein LOC134528328 n=1 Tax=Bacillus rossius redtenbacheri TaxID=93214 RepID=UPI002FDEF198
MATKGDKSYCDSLFEHRKLRYDIENLKKMKETAQSEKLKLEMHKLEVMNELRLYECMLRDLKADRRTVRPEDYFNRPHVRQAAAPRAPGPGTPRSRPEADDVNREHIDIGLNTLQCMVNGEIYLTDNEENEDDEDEDEYDEEKDELSMDQNQGVF